MRHLILPITNMFGASQGPSALPPVTAPAQHHYSATPAHFALPFHQQPQALPASSHSDPPPNPSAAAASSALHSVAESGSPIPRTVDLYATNAGYKGDLLYAACPADGMASASAIFNQTIDPQIYGAIGTTTIPVGPMIPGAANTPYVGPMWLPPAPQLVKMQKNVKKKTVQPAYCEVCKIECNSGEVLEIHKQGKKHKKNLHKLQESINPKPATVQSGNSDNRKRTATSEELEAKKRRVIEGGAAVEGVKVCAVCNVVVNSKEVFDSHLAGQKHAAMLKKLQEQQQT